MDRRLALVFAIILLSVCSVFGQDTGIRPATQLPSARVAPPSPNATADELSDQADELRAQKNYLDALDYYRAAAQKQTDKPSLAIIWNKMGIAELQMTRISDARKSFNKSLK